MAVAPQDTVIREGASFQLRAAVLDTAGRPIAGVLPKFASSDTTVATITSQGLVQSVSGGVALATATFPPFSAQAVVHVTDSNVVVRDSLPGRPYSVAVASTGVAYVSQLDLSKLTRVNLPATALAGTVGVGTIPTEVAFNSSGTVAFVTNQLDNTVGVIDVASNTETATIPVTGSPFDVLVGPGDSILYVTTNVDTLYAIRIASQAVVARFNTSSATANGLAVHDSSLYVTTRAGGTVLDINVNTNTVLHTFVVGGSPQGIVVSPNGQHLYIANENRTLQFWNATTGLSEGSVSIAGPGFGLALNPANGFLYVTTITAGKIQLVNPSTHGIVTTITVGGVVRRIGFHPSGSIGLVANEGGWVDFIH